MLQDATSASAKAVTNFPLAISLPGPTSSYRNTKLLRTAVTIRFWPEVPPSCPETCIRFQRHLYDLEYGLKTFSGTKRFAAAALHHCRCGCEAGPAFCCPRTSGSRRCDLSQIPLCGAPA